MGERNTPNKRNSREYQFTTSCNLLSISSSSTPSTVGVFIAIFMRNKNTFSRAIHCVYQQMYICSKTFYTTATITSLSICNMTKLKSAFKNIFIVELKDTHIFNGKLNRKGEQEEYGKMISNVKIMGFICSHSRLRGKISKQKWLLNVYKRRTFQEKTTIFTKLYF